MEENSLSFSQWLKKNNISIEQCAEEIGIPQKGVTRAYRGEGNIGLKLCLILHHYTNREVRLERFLNNEAFQDYEHIMKKMGKKVTR